MNHRLARAITVALALSSSGCALTFDSQHLGVPATMAEPAQAPATGTAFHVTKHPVYLLMGLIPMAQPNLEDILGGQVANGTSIANLRIRVRARWSDLLITAFTAGIVSPRSVTFEGLVVKR